MKAIMKAALVRALGLAHLYPTQRTDAEAMRALLRRLRPVCTDRPLVRLGPDRDGGYLVPDDLDGLQACFSPGVSDVSGFERDCANRGLAVFLADGSVAGPRDAHPLFTFARKYVGAVAGDDYLTLDSWVAGSLPGSTGDLLLQMDIEGYEYEVLLSTSEALMRRFRIIVAEFHWLEQLWSRPAFGFLSRAFDKVLQTHACVHLHPNNACGALRCAGIQLPRFMEATFLRRDRLRNPRPCVQFPHPLDRDNVAGRPLPLPECWYRG